MNSNLETITSLKHKVQQKLWLWLLVFVFLVFQIWILIFMIKFKKTISHIFATRKKKVSRFLTSFELHTFRPLIHLTFFPTQRLVDVRVLINKQIFPGMLPKYAENLKSLKLKKLNNL